MQTWTEWKKANRLKLQHIAGFEEMFVDNVLSKISLITPNDVTPQYHFIDRKNGNRYIDFVITIKNEDQQFLLPIELDGKTKFDTYQSFNDTLERQNDLIKTFGFLLRYSNKKMLESPQEIIDEITQFIRYTLNQQDTAKIKQRNFDQYKQSVEAQVNRLSRQVEHLKQEKQAQLEQEISALLEKKFTEQSQQLGITQLEQQIQTLSGKIHELQKPVKSQVKPMALVILAGFITAFLAIGFYFTQQNQTLEAANSTDSPREIKSENVPAAVMTKSFIKAEGAKAYLNQTTTVCDYIADIQPFSKGVYLNFAQPYPNQPLTLVIWNDKIEQFGANEIKATEHQFYCAKGVIENYKNRLQIILENPHDFYPLNEK